MAQAMQERDDPDPDRIRLLSSKAQSPLDVGKATSKACAAGGAGGLFCIAGISYAILLCILLCIWLIIYMQTTIGGDPR